MRLKKKKINKWGGGLNNLKDFNACNTVKKINTNKILAGIDLQEKKKKLKTKDFGCQPSLRTSR